MPRWGKNRNRPPAPPAAAETRGETFTEHSLSSDATAVLFGGGRNYSGEAVNEVSAMSLSGVYRAVMTIAQTMATLPLKTYVTDGENERRRVSSFLDNPAGPDSLTSFEWKETTFLHLILCGESFQYKLFTDGGQLVGLTPVHPFAVSVEEDLHEPEGVVFYVALNDGGRERLTTREMLHIPGPRISGLRGRGFLWHARNSVGTYLAGERSAATMFEQGAQIGGVLTPAQGELITPDEATDIKAELDDVLYGRSNAGKVPLINRILDYHPWQMTNADAQWLESRQYSVEEVARWLGVWPLFLMQVEKQTSWGSGVAEMGKMLGRYTLLQWSKRTEERLTRCLNGANSGPRFCEFDMAGLEQGSASDEITLIMAQVNGGFITPNEGRRLRNLGPVDGGDVLRVPSGVQLQTQLEADAAGEPVEAVADVPG